MNREYYLAHKAEILQRCKKYAEEHKAERKAYHHKWYMEHREKVLKESAERQKNNPKHTKAVLKWRKNNPDKCKTAHDRWYKRHKPEIDTKHHLKLISDLNYRRMIQAHSFVQNHKIPLKEKCEVCDGSDRLEHHHPDYSKPDYTVTLCKNCHTQIHMQGSNTQNANTNSGASE